MRSAKWSWAWTELSVQRELWIAPSVLLDKISARLGPVWVLSGPLQIVDFLQQINFDLQGHWVFSRCSESLTWSWTTPPWTWEFISLHTTRSWSRSSQWRCLRPDSASGTVSVCTGLNVELHLPPSTCLFTTNKVNFLCEIEMKKSTEHQSNSSYTNYTNYGTSRTCDEMFQSSVQGDSGEKLRCRWLGEESEQTEAIDC